MEENEKPIFEIIKTQIEGLYQEHKINRDLIRILMRNKNGDKLDIIESLVRKTAGIGCTVNLVRKETGLSKPWALEMMRRVAENNHNIRFRVGSPEYNTSSRLILVKQSDIEAFGKIENVIKDKGFITFETINQIFQLDNPSSRNLADSFCDSHPEYYINNSDYENGLANFSNGHKILPKPLTNQ